jgi:hypothetical protein
MTRTIPVLFAALALLAGCSKTPQQATIPEAITKHLARPIEHSVPYDVEVTSRLGKFLVAKGYYVPWTADGTVRVYDHDIRLNSYTTLPNGTNVPYTLAEKAKPFVRGADLRIAAYQVEQVLSVKMKKPPKAVRGKVDRYGLKVQVKVDPLLPGMPPVKSVTASVDVDYDLATGKVLQVAGLADLAKTVRKEVEKSLKNGK